MNEFQVSKHDVNNSRILSGSDELIQDGQVKVKIDAFSFTANNISYWATGEKLGYWQFFPARENSDSSWCIIPVWGFADVIESKHREIKVGERLFGYFPTAETCVMQPVNVSNALCLDGSAHRNQLPTGYNMYRRVHAEPDYHTDHDDVRMLLFPLHITAFCIHDLLASKQFFDAEQVIITSASSKTSLGLAFALQENSSAPQVIGLTSKRHVEFVRSTGYFQHTSAYSELSEIDANKKTVIVDMSGNGGLISRLHGILSENMCYSSHVGLTHWTETEKGPDFIAERSHFFFAPARIQQRYQDWGAEEFERRSSAFMQRAAKDSSRWLNMHTISGLAGLSHVFADICQGQLPANQGLIIKM